MDNTPGLADAMARSSARDSVEELRNQVQLLRQEVKRLSEQLHYLTARVNGGAP